MSKASEVSSSKVNSDLKFGFTSLVRKMTKLVEAASLLDGSQPSPTSLAKLCNQEERSKDREDSAGAIGRFLSDDSMDTEQKLGMLRQSSFRMPNSSLENNLWDDELGEHGGIVSRDFQVESEDRYCTHANSS